MIKNLHKRKTGPNKMRSKTKTVFLENNVSLLITIVKNYLIVLPIDVWSSAIADNGQQRQATFCCSSIIK